LTCWRLKPNYTHGVYLHSLLLLLVPTHLLLQREGERKKEKKKNTRGDFTCGAGRGELKVGYIYIFFL
jgi:hypothetical protein